MARTKKHKVTNKLKHQVRSRRLWHMRIEKDRKREQKKRGDKYEEIDITDSI
jgi:predicted nucleic acid-binding protein